jgi:hypothetical protein
MSPAVVTMASALSTTDGQEEKENDAQNLLHHVDC